MESPDELLRDLTTQYQVLQTLIQRINRTNSAYRLADGMTLTDLLATRDVLKKHYLFLHDFANVAVPKKERHSMNTVKFRPSVSVSDLRKQADSISAEFRRIEMKVQALNWEIDLVE